VCFASIAAASPRKLSVNSATARIIRGCHRVFTDFPLRRAAGPAGPPAHAAAAHVLNGAARLLAALPLRVVHGLGAVLGWATYLASPTYRRRLRANLAQAGLDAPPLRRAAVGHTGRQVVEALWIWQRPPADLLGMVDAQDIARMKAAQRPDAPTVFLTPHLGCFEIISKVYAAHAGADTRVMTVLYRAARRPAVEALMAQGRALPGLQLAPADMSGVRLLMRALRDRQVVGILPDQVPSRGEGVWAPFFGRPAYTMTLSARLAHSLGANVVFVYGERLARGRGFRIRVQPLTEPLSGELQHDAALLNRTLEGIVRRLPAQYLWGYNRYKVPAGAPPPPAP
jgi:KDO2-lipid IV(A) lauroyltransferase